MSATEPHSECVDELPEYLDMHQALAWVRFRDVSFVRAADPDALFAEKLWGAREPVGDHADLKAALVSKRLIAFGAKPEEEWQVVPSSQWVKLDIAPRNPSRHAPYEFIQLQSADLTKLFPASGGTATSEDAPPEQPRRRGRVKGSGSLADADAALVDEMRTLIAEGRAFSANSAAQIVAEKAAGHGTIDSKAIRLAKRYRASEPN